MGRSSLVSKGFSTGSDCCVFNISGRGPEVDPLVYPKLDSDGIVGVANGPTDMDSESELESTKDTADPAYWSLEY